MIDITCSISPSRPVCLSHVLSQCLWFPLDFGQRIQQCGLRTKSLLFKTGRHMYRPELTQALPVSPVYSISVPPTHRRERPRLNQQPAFGMTVQSQQLDSGQKTMPGLLPGAFGGLWRELGPFFTSTQWKLSLQRSAQMGALWSGFVFKLSLCYSFRPRYNFVFSVVYTVWELLYFLTWLTTAESFFFLTLSMV